MSRRALLGGAVVGSAASTAPTAPALAARAESGRAPTARSDAAAAVGARWWADVGDFTPVLSPTSTVTGGPAYLNDHCVVHAADGWHLFSIIGERPPPDQAPDSQAEQTLAHFTAPVLTGPWTRRADALRVDRGGGEQHLWAPHVVAADGVWHLFYAAGGVEGSAICRATSSDLTTWRRDPAGPLFRGLVARDPMVIRIDGVIGGPWVMYATEVAARGGRHVVVARTSPDLRTWSAPRTVFTDASDEGTVSVTESPFVVERDGWFHLFLGPRHGYVGTDVLRSRDPFAFDVADVAGHLPAHAAEVVRDGDTWWVTAAGWWQRGLLLAPLRWSTTATPWQSPDNPVAGLGAGDRLHVLALAAGRSAMLHRVQLDPARDSWSDWETFGGPAGAVPTVGRNADGRLEVFSLAPGGAHLHHRVQRADGGWGAWEEFGGQAGAAPAVALDGAGRLQVFALGPDGANLACRRQSTPGGGAWDPWVGDFAGRLGGPPVVAANADGRLEVLALGPGGADLRHRWQTRPGGGPTEWSDWTTFGTAAGAVPRMLRDRAGLLTVTAVGPSGLDSFSRRQVAPSGTWGEWRYRGGWTAPAVPLAQGASGPLVSLGLTPGGDVLTVRTDRGDGSWSAAVGIGPGPRLAGPPTAVRDASGRVRLLAVDLEGRPHLATLEAAGRSVGGWAAFGDVRLAT